MKSSLAHVLTSRRTPLVWISGALAVVLCGGGVAAAVAVGGRTATLTEQASVARGTIATTVPAVGTIAAPRGIPLTFGTTGTVASVDVRPGEHVTAGQVLATLDRAPLRTGLDQARAVLAQAETTARALVTHATSTGGPAGDALLAQDQAAIDDARQRASGFADDAAADAAVMRTACDGSGAHPTGTPAACARAEVKRLNDLTSYSLTALQLTDAGDAYSGDVLRLPGQRARIDPRQIGVDQAAVARAQQAVADDERSLAQSAITAPADGTVTAVAGATGDTEVEVDTSSGRVMPVKTKPTLAAAAPGTGFLTFAPSPSARIAQVWVTSGGVQSVLQGQVATVSYPGGQRTGTVIAIGSTASRTDGQWAYPVTVSLGSTGASGPAPTTGAAVTAQITTATRPNVVYVPRGAVANHHGHHEVTVVDSGPSGGRHVVRVWPGYHGSRFTEIVAGLTPGETVLNHVPADDPSDAPTF